MKHDVVVVRADPVDFSNADEQRSPIDPHSESLARHQWVGHGAGAMRTQGREHRLEPRRIAGDPSAQRILRAGEGERESCAVDGLQQVVERVDAEGVERAIVMRGDKDVRNSGSLGP